MEKESENWIEFGLWVKRKRDAKGLTQEELAKLVGFSDRQTIYRIEAGASTKRPSVVKIARALGESPNDALAIAFGLSKSSESADDVAERAAQATRMGELVKGFGLLPPKEQEQILAIIRVLQSDHPELLKAPIEITDAKDLTESDAEIDTDDPP
jgi:transcriptional regulator with XRE-family HTH domain